jgi:hypothetical protein
MLRRRRPLLRAAVVGGGAYVAGKKVARNRAERDQQEATQDERISNLEDDQAGQQTAPYATPPPAPAAEPAAPSMSDQLQQLSALHEQGVLTDEEFAAAKSKVLGI